jgi:hypothetical protein
VGSFSFQAVIPSTCLEDMANTLKNDSQFVEPSISFDWDHASYKRDVELFHEAGYDAYQTGYAFLKMIYYLSKNQKETYHRMCELAYISL